MKKPKKPTAPKKVDITKPDTTQRILISKKKCGGKCSDICTNINDNQDDPYEECSFECCDGYGFACSRLKVTVQDILEEIPYDVHPQDVTLCISTDGGILGFSSNDCDISIIYEISGIENDKKHIDYKEKLDKANKEYDEKYSKYIKELKEYKRNLAEYNCWEIDQQVSKLLSKNKLN